MRQAGTIPDRAAAERFAAYLLTLGISAQIDNADQGWAVWIHDDRHLQRSREELAAFVADPEAQQYREALSRAEEIVRQQEVEQKQHTRNIVDVRRRWRPWTEGEFPLTMVLIGLSVGLTLAAHFVDPDWVAMWLYIAPPTAGRPVAPSLSGLEAVWHGQVWRLVTPIFLHGIWLHLLFNMYWTWQFGALIETRRGTLRLLGIVLAIAVCSNLAQYLHTGPRFGGMSGVGFGMFGYIWMKSRFDPVAGIQIDSSLVFMFLAWLFLCMTPWLQLDIANTAHVVGLLSGAAIGFAPVVWRRLRPR